MPDSEILPGAVVWGSLDPIRGREQGGHRPLLVVASQECLNEARTWLFDFLRD